MPSVDPLLAEAAPAWLALSLAVIGGGAVGSILTTFWRIRFERSEAWRTRLLASADDFATGTLQALMKLESNGDWFWLSHEGGDPFLSHAEADAMREADALVEEARARLARIHLLYGSTAATGASATTLIDALRAMSKALWGDPDGGGLDWNAADNALKRARVNFEDFVTNARLAAIKGSIKPDVNLPQLVSWAQRAHKPATKPEE